jgi:hypothetical protein
MVGGPKGAGGAATPEPGGSPGKPSADAGTPGARTGPGEEQRDDDGKRRDRERESGPSEQAAKAAQHPHDDEKSHRDDRQRPVPQEHRRPNDRDDDRHPNGQEEQGDDQCEGPTLDEPPRRRAATHRQLPLGELAAEHGLDRSQRNASLLESGLTRRQPLKAQAGKQQNSRDPPG